MSLTQKLGERGCFAKVSYIRTKDGREVDFVAIERETLYILVEAKKDDKNIVPIA